MDMKKLAKLTAIGIISGIILALFLKIIKSTTGNNVYDLLFDTSYIPVLNELSPTWLIESIFHFTTCILSIIVLYYVLRFFCMEKNFLPYFLTIGLGSGVLYFLTLFSVKTPPITNLAAWMYWVIGHALFSVTAVYLIRRWVA